MLNPYRYRVTAPSTPGAVATEQARCVTLVAARRAAKRFAQRKDLNNCDVRIERADGVLVEYAGPNR
jgi:hypothetical protein